MTSPTNSIGDLREEAEEQAVSNTGKKKKSLVMNERRLSAAKLSCVCVCVWVRLFEMTFSMVERKKEDNRYQLVK